MLQIEGTVFSRDLVIFPVHLGNHWTCGCINFKEKRIEYGIPFHIIPSVIGLRYYDSLKHDLKSFYSTARSVHVRPSLPLAHTYRSWLQGESLNKLSKPFDLTGWTDFFGSSCPTQV